MATVRQVLVFAAASLAALAPAACDDDGPAATADGSVDASAGDGAIVTDSGAEMGGDDGATAGAACPLPLAGEAAFARVLSGEGDFVSVAPVGPGAGQIRHGAITVHAYFPGGRRPGQPVLLAMPTKYPRPGLSWSAAGVLDSGAGVPAMPGLAIGDDLGSGFSGALVGPDQGLVGKGSKDFAFGTDVADSASGPIRLCPSGDVPPAKLVNSDIALAPSLPLWFAPTAPFDESKPPAIRVKAAGRDVPVTVKLEHLTQGGVGLVVTPAAAFPPTLPLTIDAAGFSDVLGRGFLIESIPAPLITKSLITDLGFAALPPDGAIVAQTAFGRTFTVTDGMLVVGEPGATSQVALLAALGDPGPQTKVHLRASAVCPGGVDLGPVLPGNLTIVAAQGDATRVPLACGPLQDIVVDRPPGGRLWLSIVLDPPRPHPQLLPGRGGIAIQIDQITFE